MFRPLSFSEVVAGFYGIVKGCIEEDRVFRILGFAILQA